MRKFIATAGFLGLSAFNCMAQAAELTFWSWRVEDKAFYERIAAEFKAKTGHDVKYAAYKNTEYPAALSAALAAGSGPDIIHARSYGALAALADADYLMPLTRETVPNLANFNEQALAGARGRTGGRDKSIYGVPFATQSLGIFYNKKTLADAGITQMPATWDDLKAICKTLKEKRVACIANGTNDTPGLEQLFGVVGPNFYGATDFFSAAVAGTKKFTDPAFVKAIEEVVSLKEYFPPNHLGVGENESRMLFATGAAAFYFTGIWNIETVLTLNPKAEFGIMPAPPLKSGDPAHVASFSDGNYAVNAKTKEKDAALKFMDFLASKEYGQKFTDELKQISPIAGVKVTYPLLVSMGEQAAKSGTPFLMLVGFRYQNPNGSVLLRDGIQKLIQGQGTPASLAGEIQTGLSTWHKFQ